MAPQRNLTKSEIVQIAKMPPEMTFVKSLGSGSFACVELYKYPQEDGSMIYNAVKITDDHGRESLRTEFQILSKLRGSPGIVQTFGNSLFEDFNSDGTRDLKMLMEYASAGTLNDFMNLNPKLPDSVIKDFTRMILQGLVSLHKLGYVHCDLKPTNLLIFPRYDEITSDLSYELKISDFGSATEAGNKSDCWSIEFPFVGTPLYMSPETVQEGIVEKSLDLWSLGCIVLEMYTGVPPWLGFDVYELETRLFYGNAPEIPASVPSDARQFLEKCFAMNLEERGSASELLEHPFLFEKTVNTWEIFAAGGEMKPAKTEEIAVADGERKPFKFKLTIRVSHKKAIEISGKPLKLKIIPLKPHSLKKID